MILNFFHFNELNSVNRSLKDFTEYNNSGQECPRTGTGQIL